MASSNNPNRKIPSSILILGSGVFGLTTAQTLSTHPAFKSTKLTLLDRSAFPSSDAASIDSSRIIRADYADEPYARLAAQAVRAWQTTPLGTEGDRYEKSGLCLVLGAEDETEVGRQSIAGSLANVRDRLGLKVGRREEGGEVEVLRSEDDVKRVVRGMEGNLGREGYVNWTSGWADAEAGMKFLREQVEREGRVEFRVEDVERLLFSDDDDDSSNVNGGSGGATKQRKVTGVRTASGEKIEADLVILATGAWTGRLIDLRGRASATGQAMGYVELTQEEQDRLGGNPTLLDEGNGCFIIPPRNRVLKVARHGFGYSNPVTIPHPERKQSHQQEGQDEEKITVSLPHTKHDTPSLQIPHEASSGLRSYLSRCIPSLASRPWTNTRLCWYMDTRNGDYIIDYHPDYNSSLFIATAGCGHGYKFLPVLGERIVDVLLGEDRDELGTELRRKWRWAAQRAKEDHVWTDDWRGGRKGMVLQEEYEKEEQKR